MNKRDGGIGLMRSGGLKTFLSLCVLALFAPSATNAGWQGPVKVVTGAWGDGGTEFGFKKGETMETFPERFVVLADGKILIDDATKAQLKVYTNSGELIKSRELWALGLVGLDAENIVSGKLDEKGRTWIGVYNIVKDEWRWVDLERDVGWVPSILLEVISNSAEIITWNNRDKGYRYSATGLLL